MNQLPKNGFSIDIKTALALLGILAAGFSSYYGSRLAVEENFSNLRERITTVEAKVVQVPELSAKVDQYVADVAALREGMTILLIDRGYDPTKVLGKKK